MIFAQVTTVALAIVFVVSTLKPTWLQKGQGAIAPTIVLGGSGAASGGPAGAALSAAEASSSSRSGYSLAAKRAAPTVVSIVASKAPARDSEMDERWHRFHFGQRGPGGRKDPSGERAQTGLGSGVIVSAQGYLLTNSHVVEGASDIEVLLTDGRQAKATLVGTDPETDIAVLKIELDHLPVIQFGHAETLQVGDVVLAIGNPFNVGQTVTSGIVSALGRDQLGINTFENFIQTDAAINPGNSGGALVDVDGNLVGINTAIYSRSGGSLGIGFAIPISTAAQVMESLMREGQVARGWIGVQTRELTPEFIEAFKVPVKEGVLISGVLANAPAAKAGVKPGDVITQIGSTAVHTPAQLLLAVSAVPPKTATTVTLLRGEKELAIELTVAQRPKPKQ
ncbi:2-alkenal reductase [Paucibacter sp. KCTC 42545]|nr:2-alkenal reductase [Paucibacter sp. KCTC 42545]